MKKTFLEYCHSKCFAMYVIKKYLVEPVVYKNHPLVKEEGEKIKIADLHKYPLIFQSSYSPIEAFLKLLVCQTYVTHYAESFLESPLEISNPVVSSGSYCISCCESSIALKNPRKSRICV